MPKIKHIIITIILILQIIIVILYSFYKTIYIHNYNGVLIPIYSPKYKSAKKQDKYAIKWEKKHGKGLRREIYTTIYGYLLNNITININNNFTFLRRKPFDLYENGNIDLGHINDTKIKIIGNRELNISYFIGFYGTGEIFDIHIKNGYKLKMLNNTFNLNDTDIIYFKKNGNIRNIHSDIDNNIVYVGEYTILFNKNGELLDFFKIYFYDSENIRNITLYKGYNAFEKNNKLNLSFIDPTNNYKSSIIEISFYENGEFNKIEYY